MAKGVWRATTLAESHSEQLFWAAVKPYLAKIKDPAIETTQQRLYSLAESHSATPFAVTRKIPDKQQSVEHHDPQHSDSQAETLLRIALRSCGH